MRAGEQAQATQSLVETDSDLVTNLAPGTPLPAAGMALSPAVLRGQERKPLRALWCVPRGPGPGGTRVGMPSVTSSSPFVCARTCAPTSTRTAACFKITRRFGTQRFGLQVHSCRGEN